MGKLSLAKMLDCFCLSSPGSCSCFCLNTLESQDEFEKKPLITSEGGKLLKLKDVVAGKQTLAFQLKPKASKHFLVTSFLLSLDQEYEEK